MNQYYNVEDSFMNNNELDKMAREINNNKKNLNKNVPKQAKIHELNECTGIECLMDPSYARFIPPNLGTNFANYSHDQNIYTQLQSDFTSGFPTPMESKINSKIKLKINSNNDHLDYNKNNNNKNNNNKNNNNKNNYNKNTKKKFIIKNNKGTKIDDLLNKKYIINSDSSNNTEISNVSDSIFTDSNNTFNTLSTPNKFNNNFHQNNDGLSDGLSDGFSDELSDNLSNIIADTSVGTIIDLDNNSHKKNKNKIKIKSILKKNVLPEHDYIHTHSKHSNHNNYSDYSDQSNQNESMISDISSNYSSLSPKLKNQFKMKSKHLKNFVGNDKNVISHTTNCNQCKNLLIELLKSVVDNNNIKQHDANVSAQHNVKNLTNYIDGEQNKIKKSQFLGITISEFRELIVLAIFGIGIIVLIDIFIRNN